ncbi:MAG: FAD-dependent oxidoreductase, partial [Rhodospirillales bacterium]|nr:FAD-dependent oxidoreductase [Rhodospirillales bacterium]
SNFRTDQYGGSAENRFRFISECIAETRRLVGPEKIIGIRISAEEYEPDGLGVQAWLKIREQFNAETELDFVDVIAGSMMGPGGSFHVVPPMQIEHAYVAPKSAAIKAVMDKTVMVAGRINQPQQAEEVLAAGQAHMVGMTRAMIADPDMPNKAKAGNLDSIRACIGCNQACIGHFHMGVPISCIQNPVSGRELKLGTRANAEAKRKVLIAGGGPGGMRAAVEAANRGHNVILCEAATQLGGQTLLGQLLPNRSEFGGITTNLKYELDQAGVEIRLNTPVNRALVEAEQPDAIIIATGATPYTPNVEIADDVHCADAWQILRGEINPGANVVVADWRCDWVGLGVAEKLALEGCNVHLCINGETLGQNLQLYQRLYWAGAIYKLGVKVTHYARLFGADGDTVYFHNNVSGEPIICEGVDTLVMAQGHTQEITLANELEGMDLEIHMVGDCLSPRSAEEAIYEGLVAGRNV